MLSVLCTHHGLNLCSLIWILGLPRWLTGEESACQCRRLGFDSWVKKTPLEEEMANHSSILAWEIPMDRGAWWATVHAVAKELDVI